MVSPSSGTEGKIPMRGRDESDGQQSCLYTAQVITFGFRVEYSVTVRSICVPSNPPSC